MADNKDYSEAVGRVWANRIVGHEMVDPNTLLANPKNFRIHPKQQQDVVEGSLDRLGWLDEITVNVNTDFVVDGHLRAAKALARGETLVPVKYVDLTPEEEEIAIAVFDQSTSLAGLDTEKMAELFAGIEAENAALDAFFTELVAEIKQTDEQVKEGDGSGMGKEEESQEEEMEAVDLSTECSIEIICTRKDLDEFSPTLRKWGRRPSVTVNFNLDTTPYVKRDYGWDEEEGEEGEGEEGDDNN